VVSDFGFDGADVDWEPSSASCTASSGVVNCPTDAQAVAAVTALRAAGISPEVLATAMAGVHVPGRMEIIDAGQDFTAIVDYAHSPDAVERVISAVIPSGRRIIVLGCGGDRDREKRYAMGDVAAAGADILIVTDDNPRSETPAAIRAAILAASPGAIEIGDRAEAIRDAVRGLMPGDVLVVAGKGHESGQIVGDQTLPFSDHHEITQAMREFSR
jgi:UDP-N-acetylmuramoyl-L-alanyl-D-glutamate--2,6-diaminopimelate ligase